ncbi:MAG TPA: hypothetical protein VLC08_09735, partial [Chitinolyticbacter sp.]|nr:hypothetical protein [Chitinolyticbacter sp.]
MRALRQAPRWGDVSERHAGARRPASIVVFPAPKQVLDLGVMRERLYLTAFPAAPHHRPVIRQSRSKRRWWVLTPVYSNKGNTMSIARYSMIAA